jgi:hypothetical protein
MANKLTGTGIQFQQLSSDPGSPVSGQVYYNTSSNKLKQYDGSSWGDVGSGSGAAPTFTISTSTPSGTPAEGSEWWDPDDTKLYKYIAIRSGEPAGTSLWRSMSATSTDGVTVAAGSFKFKHIYAQSYTCAGYKDSSPWKNVNRTIHATDITTNLGDRLDRSQGYCDGGWDDVGEITYGHGMGNVQGGSHNWTSAYNMRTDAGVGGAANMTHARSDCGVAVDMNNRTGYLGGGGNDTFTKMSYTTNTGVTGTSFAGGSAGGQSTASFSEYKGWFNMAGTARVLVFATDSGSAWSRAYGQNGCQKGLSSKNGYFLSGRDGACGSDSGFDEYDDTSGAYRWNGAKPLNCGEENYSMGQDKGFMMGQYDGLQNNKAFTWVYASRSGVVLGAAGMPKGHDGMSSGWGASRKG